LAVTDDLTALRERAALGRHRFRLLTHGSIKCAISTLSQRPSYSAVSAHDDVRVV
jgi:hypothetical protein